MQPTNAPSKPLIHELDFVISKNDFITPRDVKVNVGNGIFGKIIKGQYQNTQVAVKFFNIKSFSPHLEKEFDLHCIATHPNIIKFYGVCIKPGRFSMLTEIMHTTLNAYLTTLAPNEAVPSQTKKLIGRGILQGLAYLHSIGFAHKNLKDRNVFLTPEFVVKIGDFGLSLLEVEAACPHTGEGGPSVRWRPPETFTREYSKIKDNLDVKISGDIFNFGLLIWQLFTKKIPFEGHTEVSTLQLLNTGTREHIDSSWPNSYRVLISNCWSFVLTSRPSVIKILGMYDESDAFKVFLIFASRAQDGNSFSGKSDLLKHHIFRYLDKCHLEHYL